MSVENLRTLVDRFGTVPHGESTLPGLTCLHCVCEAAKKELEALERTAKTVRRWGIGWIILRDDVSEEERTAAYRDKRAAEEFITQAAKEAP